MKEYKTKILAIQYEGENKVEIVECIEKMKYEVVSIEEKDDELSITYIGDYMTFYFNPEILPIHILCSLKKGDYLKIEGDSFRAIRKEEFERMYKEI